MMRIIWLVALLTLGIASSAGTANAAEIAEPWGKFGWGFSHAILDGSAGCPFVVTCELIPDEEARPLWYIPWEVHVGKGGARVEVGRVITMDYWEWSFGVDIVAMPELTPTLDPYYVDTPYFKGTYVARLDPGHYWLWIVPVRSGGGVATWRLVHTTVPEPATAALVAVGLMAVHQTTRRRRSFAP